MVKIIKHMEQYQCKIKKEASIIFFTKYNFKYKLISPRKLKFDEIKFLVEQTKVIFVDRYKKKFELWKEKEHC